MRLALSSYTYSWSIGVPGYSPSQPMSAVGLLERAAELGVHVVQVADNLPLDQLGAAELDAVEATAERLGVAIVRVVIDTVMHHPSPDEVVAVLATLEGEFRHSGVRLAIENHERFTTDVFANIVYRLGNWVGICLDTVNSFGALEGPHAAVSTLGALTINLHVKDFTIDRADHMMGFSIEGRPAGQGRLNVPWVIQTLHGYGCDADGTMTAVLELWTPPETSLDDAIAKEQRWAEESVAYLRSLIQL